MRVEIRLPPLAEGMTSARIAAWLRAEGDRIETGDVIAEVETDKTSVELESPAAGTLGAIVVPAGTGEVAIGALLATIVDDTPAEAVAPATASAQAAIPSPDPGAPDRPAARSAPAAPVSHDDADVTATPLARRMAALAGLDLRTVPRAASEDVTRADVERALGLGAPAPLTPARRVTAERLVHAKQTIPHFYLEIECTVDEVDQRRRAHNARPGAIKLTLTDLVVGAAARALADVPAVNATWQDPGARLHRSADIAVAVDTVHGLMVPIVRDAGALVPTEIAVELRRLVELAQAGRLAPRDYAGGTFTISNLGMYGTRSLYPIVNPPQVAILGVGAASARPVVRDGAVAAATLMTCTLSADHRAIDGATGAAFLAAFRRRLEETAVD